MVNNTYKYSKATIIVALLLMSYSKVMAQNRDIFNKNHWGLYIINAIAPPNIININSKYVLLEPLANYHFGGGFVYHFNINKKYSIQSGFIAEYRNHSYSYEWYPKNLYTDLNIKTYGFVPEVSDDGISVVFLQSYQSFSIPLSFNYNFYQNNHFIISAKTGINFRYYFQSSLSHSATIGSSKIFVELYSYKIFINPKRSVEIDSQTAVTFSFVLKNKKLINISILSNIALYTVNKSTIFYMRNTPLEQKSDVIVNDHYFGIGLSYLFTGIANPKNRNRKIEWFPENDSDY